MHFMFRKPTGCVPAVYCLMISLISPGSASAQGYPEGHGAALGPKYADLRQSPPGPPAGRPIRGTDLKSCILDWNGVLLDANALDHTPPAPGETRVFGEQYGPARTARAFAVVHIAMFDAMNAVVGGYESYTGLPSVKGTASLTAAVAKAAHDALVALYPSQSARFDELLAASLAGVPLGKPKTNGIELGRRSAAAILVLRNQDGSQYPDPVVGVEFLTSDQPGLWRQDPISLIPHALGAYWGGLTPFVMTTSSQFRSPPPPSMQSPEYAAAFHEVKRLGGDGITTPTERTRDQTIAGIFWGYDGTPGLGTPPRMFNQIVLQIAEQMNSGAVELMRLLALENVALADAAIAAWDTKYCYQFWRPIIAIREADEGTGPTGLGDGNPDTVCDPAWTPLGAQASNLAGPNFSPPFPAYTSGHATFGGATFQTLRRFYETDAIAFTRISDEWNGATLDNLGNVRPLIPRTFSSLSQAEEENGQSRIYLGVHWNFDKTMGIAAGRAVADHVFEHAFRPIQKPGKPR